MPKVSTPARVRNGQRNPLSRRERLLLDTLRMARGVIADCRALLPQVKHDDGIPVEALIDAVIAETAGA